MSTKQPDETKYRWYMVNKDGIVTLCADQADAEQEAKDSQEVWPHMGPYRAVQLVEASQAFTAADMATAAAQGFRDGQAAELAAMRAGGEPVGWMWQHEENGRTGFVDCWQVENGWQENNPRLRLVSKLYTHPQPAAQDAERNDELGAPFLLHNDFCDLHRFFETSEDDESYDIPKDRMKRLAALGVVQHHGFGRYSITAFGHYVHELCWEQKPELPLLLNDDRDRIKRAAIAAQQGDSHE